MLRKPFAAAKKTLAPKANTHAHRTQQLLSETHEHRPDSDKRGQRCLRVTHWNWKRRTMKRKKKNNFATTGELSKKLRLSFDARVFFLLPTPLQLSICCRRCCCCILCGALHIAVFVNLPRYLKHFIKFLLFVNTVRVISCRTYSEFDPSHSIFVRYLYIFA